MFKMISKEVLHQTLALTIVAFNEFTIGIALGWVSPTLGLLKNPDTDFTITAEQSSWIASLDNFGKIFGALLSAVSLDLVGRKFLLTVSASLFFLIWVPLVITKSATILCLMRLIFGLAIGLNDGANCNYLAENSSPKIRAIVGTASIMLYNFGFLIETAIASYLSFTLTAYINCVVTFFALLSVFWIKEPVQFLLMKEKHKQAERNFAWLKGVNDPADAATEYEKIKQNVHLEKLKKSSFKTAITDPVNYKSLFIIITIYCLTGSMGYFPLLSYTSITFSETENLKPNDFVVIFSVFQLISAMLASFTASKFNRRSIMLISFSIIALIHACSAALYYFKDCIPAEYFPWLVFNSITTFAIVFAYLYPVVFLIRGELFPLSIKATGGCIAVMGLSVTSFLTTKIFLYVVSVWGMAVNFTFFSIISLISVAFVYFMFPETRNKTLIEIQQILENKNN